MKTKLILALVCLGLAFASCEKSEVKPNNIGYTIEVLERPLSMLKVWVTTPDTTAMITSLTTKLHVKGNQLIISNFSGESVKFRVNGISFTVKDKQDYRFE